MALEFKTIELSGGRFPDWVQGLKGKSGVYIIRDKAIIEEVIYVGESHTGRLYKTLIRHFERWKGKTAGPTFNASDVMVAVVRCPDSKAVELQNSIIAEYRPKLNDIGKPKNWMERLFGK